MYLPKAFIHTCAQIPYDNIGTSTYKSGKYPCFYQGAWLCIEYNKVIWQ